MVNHHVLFIGIIIILLVGGGVLVYNDLNKSSDSLPLLTQQTTNSSSDNRITPTPIFMPTSTPKTSFVPTLILPVAPTPIPNVKLISTPTPTPIPTPNPTPTPFPTQSQKFSSTADVFAMQDDGMMVQSGDIVDVGAVARKFYSLYPGKDSYDFLNIFTTFNDASKPCLHFMVKNNVAGIGVERSDASSAFGSNKLLGINFFNTTYTSDQSNSTEQMIRVNMHVIDHELSHQWLMYIGNSFGFRADDEAHYNRWANTGFTKDGEVGWVDTNGGFSWKDNQNGTLSIPDTSFYVKRGFSKLSLYLMGLIPPSEVPDFTVVVPEDLTDNVSKTILGTFKNISINDIIAKYGERIPSYQSSQKNFRMAYILLSKKDETPAQYQLNAVNYIAQNYPSWWNSMTYGKSTINQ